MSRTFNNLRSRQGINENFLSSIKSALSSLQGNLLKAFKGVADKLKNLKVGETHAVSISIPHPVMENHYLDKAKVRLADQGKWSTLTNFTGFLNERAIISSMFSIPHGFKSLTVTDKGREVSKETAKQDMDDYLEASLFAADNVTNERRIPEYRDMLKNIMDSASMTAQTIIQDAELRANEHGKASSFSCIVEFSGVEGVGKEKADLRVLYKKEEEDNPEVVIRASLKKYYSSPAKTKIADKAFADGTQTSGIGLMFTLYYGPGQLGKIKRAIKFIERHHSAWSKKAGFHIRHKIGTRGKETYDAPHSFNTLRQKTKQDITKLKDIDGYVNNQVLMQHMFMRLGMDWNKYQTLIQKQVVGIVADKRGDLLKAYNTMLMDFCKNMYEKQPHKFINHVFAATGFFEDQYITIGQQGMFKVYSSVHTSNPMGTGMEAVIWDMVEKGEIKASFENNQIYIKDGSGKSIHNPIYIDLRGVSKGVLGAVDCSYFLDPDTEVLYSNDIQKSMKVLDNIQRGPEFKKGSKEFKQHLKFDDFKL